MQNYSLIGSLVPKRFSLSGSKLSSHTVVLHNVQPVMNYYQSNTISVNLHVCSNLLYTDTFCVGDN